MDTGGIKAAGRGAPELSEFVPERFEHGGIDFRGRELEFGAWSVPASRTYASLPYHFDWELPDEMGITNQAV
jgi:hypothetical protein